MAQMILLVDDEINFRTILGRVLTAAGYGVVAAADGAEGLRLFSERAPDLVVLDGQLPDIDGFEVCRRLRATTRGAKVPILMCTVRSGLSIVSAGFDAGADGYLLKPFETKELLEKISEALDRAGKGA